MQLLSTENLTLRKGDKLLLEEVSFGIEAGQKLALIGANGSGKSSLLAVLDGRDDEYGGTLSRARGLTISTLRQVPAFRPDETILEYVLSGEGEREGLLRDYEACLVSLHHADTPERQARLGLLMERMETAGAWEYERRFASVLSELGIDNTGLVMGELSGGMVRKVDLARALVHEADLLLLDEPTNHLDLRTILWLEQYLSRTGQAMVLVTHDRYFLDTVCSTILEMEDNRLYRYEGNYSYYMEKRAEREDMAAREQDKLKNVLRRELAWLRRGAKARSTKQKARIDRYGELASRVTKEEAVSSVFEVGHRRLGKSILELEAVAKKYDGRQVIAPFSRLIKKGERLGFVGPNGSGKTTLLRLMTGEVVPDTGRVIPGLNTRFGVFDQTSQALDPEGTVLEYLKEEAEHVRRADGSVLSVEQLLERFLFPRHSFRKQLGMLSGGERRRLQLIRVLLPDPNFLIFDEPTNDLDIHTLSLLEEFLLEFPGCAAVVSHDRYFLDRVADTLLVFDGTGGVREYPGSCSGYLAEGEARPEARAGQAPRAQAGAAALPAQGKKLTYAERLEYAGLLDEIDALERQRAECEGSLSGGETDQARIAAAAAAHAELSRRIEEKSARWEELALRAEE